VPTAREAAIRGELASGEGLNVARGHGTANGVQRIKAEAAVWGTIGGPARAPTPPDQVAHDEQVLRDRMSPQRARFQTLPSPQDGEVRPTGGPGHDSGLYSHQKVWGRGPIGNPDCEGGLLRAPPLVNNLNQI
jgi:hypothetical protein